MNKMNAGSTIDRILRNTRDEELNKLPFRQWKDTILGEIADDIEDFLWKTDDSENKRKVLREFSNELSKLYNHMEEYLGSLRR